MRQIIKTIDIFRCILTGRFVTADYAERNPFTTEPAYVSVSVEKPPKK